MSNWIDSVSAERISMTMWMIRDEQPFLR